MDVTKKIVGNILGKKVRKKRSWKRKAYMPETEDEADDMADALGIGRCPKCGAVTSNPKGHCKKR
jgi:hypothetical protein